MRYILVGMKLVSWNVNGLRSLAKDGYWESFLRERSPTSSASRRPRYQSGSTLRAVSLPAGYSAFFSSCQIKRATAASRCIQRLNPLSVIYEWVSKSSIKKTLSVQSSRTSGSLTPTSLMAEKVLSDSTTKCVSTTRSSPSSKNT